MEITTDPEKAGGVPQEETQFKSGCFNLRAALEDMKMRVLELKKNPEFDRPEQHEGMHSEMKANIMLTYRHLEDARMRLGKCVQAYDGGKSVLLS